MTQITIAELTESTLSGVGTFDVLMRATKVHLEDEFLKGRIKGPEYAQAYLSSLDSILKVSVDFLLQKQKISLESELMAQQVILAQVEVLKANAAVDLVRQQIINAQAELAIIQAGALKTAAEVRHIDSQTATTTQQASNLAAELLNIPKQGEVLSAQVCKLQAEYDLTMSQNLKSINENTLITQKVATEKAQITALGVDEDSVLGKQKLLYTAQTNGFVRDAEQKAAKALIDTWNVRKTVDSGTDANPAGLGDANITRAVTKLLAGVGA